MKRIKLFLLPFFLLFGVIMHISAQQEVPSEIVNAFAKGNVSVITSYLNDNVELVIENKNDIFSKQQTSSILTDFFRRNPANAFTVIHKGEKEAASFIIGTLKTSKGTFRVYVLTRKSGTKDVIQQLRIEPSNE